MSSSAILLVALLAFGACSLSDATPPQVVALGLDPNYLPQNVAVFVGDDVTFRCWKNPNSVNNPRIQWSEFAYPPNGGLISDDTFVLPGHPQSARYSIINDVDPVNQRDLHIRAVTLADGGRYACVDGSAVAIEVTRATVELIVIAGEQRCTQTIPDYGSGSAVVENQAIASECILNYQGNFAPFMRWNGPEPFVQIQSSTPTASYSAMQSYAHRTMTNNYWQSVANFSTLTPPPPPEGATNIPDFEHSFDTNRIRVHWTPLITHIEGTNPSNEYYAGDVLECEVDAFPQAAVEWTNLRNNQVIQGTTLTIPDSWVGESQQMRCQAMNIINNLPFSDDFFLQVIGIPPPTTPTTTTPTTTTPPPPEAECDILTGRWESTKPLNAYMCIEVDTTGESVFGNLHGVLRNGTETFWVDLVGSHDTQERSHASFTGIWPQNRYVAAFIGECSKCYGEEILIVSALSRSKGGPACATPGEILYSQEFEFKRNPTVFCPPITVPTAFEN
jgi:hypothetical protein